jgi:ribosomal-protein-alanine N-acetyltransferase
MATIRNARADEGDVLAAVGFRSWDSTAEGWGDAADIRESAYRSFETFTRNNWLSIDVAERAGQVLGWAAREKLDNAITDLWVDPVFQRQGIGTALLIHIEDEIAAAGHETALTQVHSENSAALAFFRKAGYGVSWMTTAWSPKLDRDVDTVGLVKRLVEEKTGSGYNEF